MPTAEASGTVAATGAEDTLATITANRSLISFVDLSNMQAGDTVVLRQKRKVLVAGATRTFEEETYTDAQDPPLAALNPISSLFEYVLTLEQTAGVNRNYDFTVESL